jgi:hypothetical protein
MSAFDPKRTSNVVSIRNRFATGRPDACRAYVGVFRIHETGYAKESNVTVE